MGFNSAFKGLKLLKKKPGNGRLNNLNDPVLNGLKATEDIREVAALVTLNRDYCNELLQLN